MIITKIDMTKIDDNYRKEHPLDRNFLATIDLVIDYSVVIKGIRLMTGVKGEYLKFPNDDKGRNIAFPIKEDTRQEILYAILEEYRGEN